MPSSRLKSGNPTTWFSLYIPSHPTTSPGYLVKFPPDACGTDSSATHICPNPPYLGGLPEGRPENRCSFYSCVWQRDLEGQNACWNADGIRSWKLELEHFLRQHGVHVCLLSETLLSLREAFRLANYVCHRTHRVTSRACTAVQVQRGIMYHAVPIPNLTGLEETAICYVGQPTTENPGGLPLHSRLLIE